jgi:hypothetical protein
MPLAKHTVPQFDYAHLVRPLGIGERFQVDPATVRESPVRNFGIALHAHGIALHV